HVAHKHEARLAKLYPLPNDPERGSLAQLIAAKRVAEIPDTEAPGIHPRVKAIARAGKFRSILTVPLVREGTGIGALSLSHPEPHFNWGEKQRALLQTFADQAVIAIENVRLFNETREALERQTATAEILNVIAGSPSDVQPVFDAIVQSGTRLFANAAVVAIVHDGKQLLFASIAGGDRERWQGTLPSPLSRDYMHGTAILERRLVDVSDATNPPKEWARGIRKFLKTGYRAITIAPMIRGDAAVGAISVVRESPGGLSDHQIALLKTFADQAVIAIENVRLFKELEARNSELSDALEQQTATAEILSAISSSPTDIRPILDTLVHAAARFCGAPDVALVRLDGEVLRGGAAIGPFADVLVHQLGSVQALEIPVTRGSVSGRAVVERRIVHVHDLAAEPEDEFPVGRELQRQFGHRTMVAAPLLREGAPLGVISLFRTEAKPFSDKQLGLLQIFADQAVIAIENVRLFNETKEALEQQKASAEVLAVISNSVSDAGPVFEKIAESCERLFAGMHTGILLVRDGMLHFGAHRGPERERLKALYPMPMESTAAARAIEARTVTQYPDIFRSADVPDGLRRSAKSTGARSAVIAPMLWEGRGVGTLYVARETVGAFSPKETALLKTFADQAVIAIQNTRLFNETREALERQTATAEILKVISSSPTDVQPVFDAIVQSAARLFGRRATLRLVEADGLRRRALSDAVAAEFQTAELAPIDRDSLVGRAVLDGKAMQVVDTRAPDAPPAARAHAHQWDFRSNATAPLIRDGTAIGVISLSSPNPGALSDKQMALLATFADQAVIAIENVRLFNETKEALERQTATAEILKVISGSPTDVQPVFDAISHSAARLCSGWNAAVLMRDGDLVQMRSVQGPVADHLEEWAKAFPIPYDPDKNLATRTMAERRIFEIADIEAPESAGTA
ncbi:MAG: GAF domain-containing protein, partial [Burkholderiales bacterium]